MTTDRGLPDIADERLTELFEEFLDGREHGVEVDLDGLLRRAGPRSDELQRRIDLLDHLDLLSSMVSSADRRVDLGRFQDLEPIGQGGLSTVFRAHDPELDRDVALKVLDHATVRMGDARQWMVTEGRALAQLEHPNVVRVFEVDEADDLAYVAMEWISGPSLQAVLDALRHLEGAGDPTALETSVLEAAQRLREPVARVQLVEQLAQALSACHGRGLVHRDIKPGNVLITEQGTPKLIDFGLAHKGEEAGALGLTQRLVGTPAYMAPEQVDTGRTGADPRSDQFSLGVLLYELLTLRSPFAGKSRDETLTAISRCAPEDPQRLAPGLPRGAARVCMHCLEKNPEHRYPDLSSLASDLSAIRNFRPISLPASPLLNLRLWLRRNRRELIGASLALGLGALVWTTAIGFWKTNTAQAAILGEVDRLQRMTAETETPVQFEELLKGLINLEFRVRELADEGLPRSAADEPRERLNALTRESSERLGVALDAAYAGIEKHASIGSRVYDYVTLKSIWDPLLTLEEQASPYCDLNDPFRRYGRVRFPGGGVLYRYRPMGPRDFPELDRTPTATQVDSGNYRFLFEAPDGVVDEVEFTSLTWMPEEIIEARRTPEPLLSSLVRCEGEVLRGSVKGRDEDRMYAVPDFLISPAPLTWGQVLEALAPERREALLEHPFVRERRPLPVAAPVEVHWSLAQSIVRDLGGRMPSPCELLVAERRGLLEKEDTPDTIELTFDFWRETSFERLIIRRSALRERARIEAPLTAGSEWFESIPEVTRGGQPRLRLVRSLSTDVPHYVRR